MSDLKKDVSSRFKVSYDDIDNFEEIEKEIKEKSNAIKLKFSKIETSNVEKMSLKQFPAIKVEFPLTINKKDIFNTEKMFKKRLDSQGIYNFGAEISEDNKFILCYVDVLNLINNIKNESAYSICLEYGRNKNN